MVMDYSKERVDYPQLLFQQIDRVCAILSNPIIDYNQLGRAVDALAAIASFIEDFNFSATETFTSDNQKYKKIIETIEQVIKKLHEKNLLLRLRTVGRLGDSQSQDYPKV